MEPKKLELECQVCGTRVKSTYPKEQCEFCGGQMIVAPFFSLQQTESLSLNNIPARTNWLAVIAMALIGMVAAGLFLFTQETKTPVVKQETKKSK